MISPLAALLRLHEINVSSPRPDGPRSAEVQRLLLALTPELHQKYLNNYLRHGSMAVVPVERGACTGCYTRQPRQPYYVDDGVLECQHCGRLLYDRDEAYELSVG